MKKIYILITMLSIGLLISLFYEPQREYIYHGNLYEFVDGEVVPLSRADVDMGDIFKVYNMYGGNPIFLNEKVKVIASDANRVWLKMDHDLFLEFSFTRDNQFIYLIRA